jgi:hypothetical protein
MACALMNGLSLGSDEGNGVNTWSEAIICTGRSHGGRTIAWCKLGNGSFNGLSLGIDDRPSVSFPSFHKTSVYMV